MQCAEASLTVKLGGRRGSLCARELATQTAIHENRQGFDPRRQVGQALVFREERRVGDVASGWEICYPLLKPRSIDFQMAIIRKD